MRCRKRLLEKVREDYSEEVISELSSNSVLNIWNTPGRGGKSDNPTMLPFCRSNRKDIIFTKKRNKQIPRVLCICVAICIMENVFGTYK